jgi:hypothetical protein
MARRNTLFIFRQQLPRTNNKRSGCWNNVFELLVEAFPEAASVQSASGLPLDIANAHGSTEEEVRPLIVEGAVRENKMEHTEHSPNHH